MLAPTRFERMQQRRRRSKQRVGGRWTERAGRKWPIDRRTIRLWLVAIERRLFAAMIEPLRKLWFDCGWSGQTLITIWIDVWLGSSSQANMQKEEQTLLVFESIWMNERAGKKRKSVWIWERGRKTAKWCRNARPVNRSIDCVSQTRHTFDQLLSSLFINRFLLSILLSLDKPIYIFIINTKTKHEKINNYPRTIQMASGSTIEMRTKQIHVSWFF